MAGLHADGHIQWLSWRGPNGDGVSPEKYKNWAFDEKPAWTFDMKGRGAPVVADGKAYVFGYRGEGPDVEETLTCLDAKTGKQIWQHSFRDYISDTIYDRYAIGSAAVDPDTRNVYLQTTNGRFLAFTAGGKLLWQHSTMERFGRLTFPNGRTGAPIVEGELVIMHCISSYWGKQGPARDRFYGFDKRSGEIVWISEPGIRPRDSSYSTPAVETRYGTRVFYAGTGCGNIVCINALNGKALWRFHLGIGGVNASPVIFKDRVIAPARQGEPRHHRGGPPGRRQTSGDSGLRRPAGGASGGRRDLAPANLLLHQLPDAGRRPRLPDLQGRRTELHQTRRPASACGT